jgi:ribosomal protein S1
MLRFALGLLMVVGLTLAAGGIAVAEEAKCEGTIAKIEGNTVTVKATDGKEHVMDLSPATQVKLDDKPAKSSDLKVGQKVKCTYDKSGDKLTCRVIEASST